MRICLRALLLVCVIRWAPVNAQVVAPAPATAYDRCTNAMQFDRAAAYRICSEYLKTSDNNPDHVRAVTKWIAAYDHAVGYAKSLASFSANTAQHDWLFYEPDLKVELPELVQKDGPYKIEIGYSYQSPLEAALLKKAEAVYGPQDEFIRMINRDPASWSEDLPDAIAPVWGVRDNDNVQVAQVITASAVRYYYDLSLAMREKRKFRNVFPMVSTRLKYSASIKQLDRYEHGSRQFENVFVADLNLEWSSICGGLCGIGFKRNKLVVFDNEGNVLALFLDAADNRSMWVS